jgi:putative PIN family toxin of toxin-antitoxin system
MIGLVIDTNVLVSANLNAGGLEAVVVALAFNQKTRMYVSGPILAEYERVLLYPRLKFKPAQIRKVMRLLRDRSVLVAPARVVTACRDDPDNRFLECAEAAAAEFLVTGNKRHFPERWKTTRVVNSRELLGLIGPSFLR